MKPAGALTILDHDLLSDADREAFLRQLYQREYDAIKLENPIEDIEPALRHITYRVYTSYSHGKRIRIKRHGKIVTKIRYGKRIRKTPKEVELIKYGGVWYTIGSKRRPPPLDQIAQDVLANTVNAEDLPHGMVDELLIRLRKYGKKG